MPYYILKNRMEYFNKLSRLLYSGMTPCSLVGRKVLMFLGILYHYLQSKGSSKPGGLKMEAAGFSEMLITTYLTTWWHNAKRMSLSTFCKLQKLQTIKEETIWIRKAWEEPFQGYIQNTLVEAMENKKQYEYLLKQVRYITKVLCCKQKCTALLRLSKNEQVVFRQARFLKQSMEKDSNHSEGRDGRMVGMTMILRNLLPSSSGRWWSQQIPLECKCISTKLHGVTSQKIFIFMVTTWEPRISSGS